MAWSISNAMMKDYENSNSLQARGGGFSLANYLDGEPSAQSSTTPMPDQFYWPDKTMEHSRLSRFGITCVRFAENHGEGLLMWFQEDSHARILARPAKEQELKENEAVYGMKWHASFAKFDHDLSSWKTAQCSLLGGSERFSETWPRWGLMQNGECLELPMWGGIASGNDAGLLPAPQKTDGRGFYIITRDSAAKRIRKGISQKMVIHVVGLTAYGHLNRFHANPPFWQAMMAWPIQWTSLTALGTDKMQNWLQQHGAS